MKRIVRFINDNRYKVILSSILVTFLLIFFIAYSFAATVPVESIEIKSENLDYDKKEPGAWKVTKSAHWLSNGKARITFDVDSIEKNDDNDRDIIFVVDSSASMYFGNTSSVSNNISEVLTELKNDGNINRVALISFNNTATILSDFTADLDSVSDLVNGIVSDGGTNYYQALKKVDELLSKYTYDKKKEVSLVFLTDGCPIFDTPNEVGEYKYLKSKYDYLDVRAIQYDVGSTVLDTIKNISDKQYVADKDTIKDVLHRAMFGAIVYDEFKLEDTINSSYFDIDNVSSKDASVSSDKVVWQISNYDSGSKAKLTIDVSLKSKYLSVMDLYETNSSEKVVSKIGDDEENVTSTLTPVLSNNYTVKYNVNAPTDCKVINSPSNEKHIVFQTVDVSNNIPICFGYEFKGWKIVTSGVETISDDEFVMPVKDVELVATWSKLSLNKSSTGTISEAATLYKVVKNDALNDNYAKKYTGSTKGFTGNKDVYYYYGDATNNNVLFANFCWKMVRTTDTAGVKIVYNGEPDSNGTCSDTDPALVLDNSRGTYFNIIGDSTTNVGNTFISNAGYMNNVTNNIKYYDNYSRSTAEYYDYTIITTDTANIMDTDFYFSSSYRYDAPVYTLVDPESLYDAGDTSYLAGKYICRKGAYCSESIQYVLFVEGDTYYAINLFYGDALSDAENIVFGKGYTENSTGTFTLTDTVTIEKKDYYTDYSNYVGYYTCGDYHTTCSDLKLIKSATNTKINVLDFSKGYKYGNSFVYENGMYKLVDTDVSSIVTVADINSQIDKLTKAHYTCFNTTGTCSKIYYAFYSMAPKDVLLVYSLNSGKGINDLLNDMLLGDDVNTEDSTIKAGIDSWYEAYLSNYSDYLEDTVWCNNRSIYKLAGFDPDNGELKENLLFQDPSSTSLACVNKNDRFTVKNSNGNMALKYPIALLDYNEVNLAGASGFLKTSSAFWTMSPYGFYRSSNAAFINVVRNGSLAQVSSLSSIVYARPAVSLASGTEYISGDGSAENPYVVASR